jgi:hypothetical protein
MHLKSILELFYGYGESYISGSKVYLVESSTRGGICEVAVPLAFWTHELNLLLLII